jgi:hypothetical protein
LRKSSKTKLAEAEAKKARALAKAEARQQTRKAQNIICDKILQGQHVTDEELKQVFVTDDSVEQIRAMYLCLNVTVNTEALDILSKICSGGQPL